MTEVRTKELQLMHPFYTQQKSKEQSFQADLRGLSRPKDFHDFSISYNCLPLSFELL